MTFDQYREIFRVASFRRFWIGFTCSVLGDSLTRVAFTWYVYELSGSAEALGWLMLCFTGPVLLGGLAAGWLLDRFDRRAVMIADSVVRGATVALVPLLHALGLLEIWHIYAVAAIYGLLMMIALAGGPALIPSLVPSRLLGVANALEILSFTLGGVIGPLTAGVLIAWIGAPSAVWIDAASYLVFAAQLARVQLESPGSTISGGRRSTGLGDAVRLLISHPVLLSTTLMFLVYNIGGGALAVALPLFTDRVLRGGPELYGGLLGAIALGEVAGALVAGRVGPRLPTGLRICFAQLLAGVALVGLHIDGTWAATVSLVLFGAFSAPLTIWAQTLRMQIIPPDLRGRSFALLRMLMQGGNPLGGAAAGTAHPILGLSALLVGAALLAGMPGVAGLGVRALRSAGDPREQLEAVQVTS
jgi:MFS family permease